jgi:hypothetical protein
MFLGVLLMLASTFTTAKPYTRWVKLDLRISGLTGLFAIGAKLALLLFGDSMTPFAFQALDYIKTLLFGVPLGLIALLFLSGELRRTPRKNEE